MTTKNKINKLTALRDALLDCCKESVKNAEEWQAFHDMKEKVDELLHKEYVANGWCGVYEIVKGCSGDCLFEGTEPSCMVYAEIMLEHHPERKGNIIITPLY